MEGAVIFPHQLFVRHPSVRRGRVVFLVEDPRFFGERVSGIRFHKNKLILHRASMSAYGDSLLAAGYTVHYVDYEQIRDPNDLLHILSKKGMTEIYVADPTDEVIEQRLKNRQEHSAITFHIDPSPAFLTHPAWFENVFGNTSRYSMTRFYIAQRKRLGILLNRGKPVGGKWTFDTENRKPLPAALSIPDPWLPPSNAYVEEARKYVHRHFSDNPGRTSSFCYPVTHDEAMDQLRDFLEHRLVHFGSYQDALCKNRSVLFHSVLSSSLNIGLLTPDQVVDETLNFAGAHGDKIPLNSVEGFIRQIIGWREFVRAVYMLEGRRQRTLNFWGHRRKLPASFYDGTTGIEPVDDVIIRVHESAYAHHIERLMVLGNFMLLCEIDPDDIYRWFMELFIDSYDWVMVPNIYGMSQYADGGLMTTKPYISSSKYVLRMSDYPRGAWCDRWDALYWNFVSKHGDTFRRNPRMSVMVSALHRMAPEKRSAYCVQAEEYLKGL